MCLHDSELYKGVKRIFELSCQEPLTVVKSLLWSFLKKSLR